MASSCARCDVKATASSNTNSSSSSSTLQPSGPSSSSSRQVAPTLKFPVYGVLSSDNGGPSAPTASSMTVSKPPKAPMSSMIRGSHRRLDLSSNKSHVGRMIVSKSNANGPVSFHPVGMNGMGMQDPVLHAIRGRVDDLFRRIDDVFNPTDAQGRKIDEYDFSSDDDDELVLPANWKVGDVLVSAHEALQKTGESSEQVILEEFLKEDLVETMASNHETVHVILNETSHVAKRVQQVFTRTIQLMKSMQESTNMLMTTNGKGVTDLVHQVRDLRFANDALHKEKAFVLGQLTENIKAHKEALASLEAQAIELKHLQVSLTLRNDEIKVIKEDSFQRVSALQREVEKHMADATNLKDRTNALNKQISALEQQKHDVEKRKLAQAEEIIKYDVLLTQKTSEIEKLKEKVRESELARTKLETLNHQNAAAANAATNAAAFAAQTSKEITARKKEEDRKAVNREAEILALQMKLREMKENYEKVDYENRELTRIVRDAQAHEGRHGAFSAASTGSGAAAGKPTLVAESSSYPSRSSTGSPRTTPKPVTPTSSKRYTNTDSVAAVIDVKPGGKAEQEPADSHGKDGNEQEQEDEGQELDEYGDDFDDDDDDGILDDDDLDDTEEDTEIKAMLDQTRDAMFAALDEAFLSTQKRLDMTDEAIDKSIAAFEDPEASPIAVMVKQSLAASAAASASQHELAAAAAAAEVSTVPESPTKRLSLIRSLTTRPAPVSAPPQTVTIEDHIAQLDRLRVLHDEEVVRMKKLYIEGLTEYKRLVIEQLERKQGEIQSRHRKEIEDLLALIQKNAKREMERKRAGMIKAKRSVRMLYRTMATQQASNEGTTDDEDERNKPYMALLRTVMNAFSGDKKKRQIATSAIHDACDRFTGGELPVLPMTRSFSMRSSSPRELVNSRGSSGTPPADLSMPSTPTSKPSTPNFLRQIGQQTSLYTAAAGEAVARRESPSLEPEGFVAMRKVKSPEQRKRTIRERDYLKLFTSEKEPTAAEPNDPDPTISYQGSMSPRRKSTLREPTGHVRNVIDLMDQRMSHRRRPRQSEIVYDVACQVYDSDLPSSPRCTYRRGLRDGSFFPENVDQYMVSSSSLTPTVRRPYRINYTQNNGEASPSSKASRTASEVLVHLDEGARFDDDVVLKLRVLAPTLPPGQYYLTARLREKLFIEICRFYSHEKGPKDPEELRVVVGVPSQMPLMRRTVMDTFSPLVPSNQTSKKPTSKNVPTVLTTLLSRK